MHPLPPEIATPADLAAVQVELTSYLDWLHLRERQSPSAPEPSKSAALTAVFRSGLPARFGEADVSTLAADLAEAGETAPVVRLTLTSPPGPKLRAELVDWFRSEIHPALLLSIHVDRSLIGGAILRAGSRLYDFSFRTLLWEHRARLAELLGHV